MSLLSRATPSTGKLSTSIPEKSAQGKFYLRHVVAPVNGSKQYPSMSVVPLEKIAVPYNHKKSASGKNAVSEYEVFNDIILEAGGQTLFISMYSVPTELLPGTIIELRGITFNAYRSKDDPSTGSLEIDQTPMSCEERKANPSFEAKQGGPCYQAMIPKVLGSIARENQTLHKERDVLSNYDILSMDLAKKKPYTFIAVRVVGENVPTDDGLCYGKFLLPNLDDPKTFAYVPFQKDNKAGAPKGEVLALSGGSQTDGTPGVRDLEFFVCQNGIDGEAAFMVSARTKLYSDSIAYFQVGNKWKQLGPVFAKDLQGTAFCVVDPAKSKDQNFTRNENTIGAIACSTTFFPDLVTMARSLGISCKWEEALAIGGISDPTKVVSASPFKSSDIINVNAVNILGYSGDISRLKKGYEDGEVEFYAVSNLHDMAKDAIVDNPDRKVSTFSNNKNFANNSPAIVIYALLKNPDGEIRIHDYLRSTPDLPAAVDTIRLSVKRVAPEPVVAEPVAKKQYVAEEEEEEVEEEAPKPKAAAKKGKKGKSDA